MLFLFIKRHRVYCNVQNGILWHTNIAPYLKSLNCEKAIDIGLSFLPDIYSPVRQLLCHHSISCWVIKNHPRWCVTDTNSEKYRLSFSQKFLRGLNIPKMCLYIESAYIPLRDLVIKGILQWITSNDKQLLRSTNLGKTMFHFHFHFLFLFFNF